MARRGQLAVVTVFVAAISIPALLSIVGARSDNLESLENRAASDLPGFSVGSLVDDEYFGALASYLTDRLPLREKAIRLDAEIDKRVTVTEPFSSDRPRGSDGWLYHPDTLIDVCVGPTVRSFLARGDALDALAREADIPYLYVVAPDKVSVYPEHLPVEGIAGLLGLSGGETPECNRVWDEALSDASADHDWLVPLADDVRADLGDPDEPLFYQGDTHWTDAGALNMVEALVERLEPGMWDPAAVEPTVPDQKASDSAILRGDDTKEEVPGYLVNRPGVTVTYERTPIGTEADGFDVIRATSTDSPLIEGTTVLVGDSFGRHTMELLGPYFEELVWVRRDYLLNHELDEVVDGRPSAIVLENVQRSVTKGWWSDLYDSVTTYLGGD